MLRRERAVTLGTSSPAPTGPPPTVTLMYLRIAGVNGSHHYHWEQSELKTSAVTNLRIRPFRGLEMVGIGCCDMLVRVG
jgi:hypothetical protein